MLLVQAIYPLIFYGGGDAHSRSDRELHGQSIFEHN